MGKNITLVKNFKLEKRGGQGKRKENIFSTEISYSNYVTIMKGIVMCVIEAYSRIYNRIICVIYSLIPAKTAQSLPVVNTKIYSRSFPS